MKRTIVVLLLTTVLAVAEEVRTFETTFTGMFTDVYVRTSFAHNYGDRIDCVVFKGRELTYGEATEVVLPEFGWNDPDKRLLLGRAWAEELAFPGYQILEEENATVRLVGEFSPPRSEVLPDGTFRYTAWTMQMVGRTPGGVVRQQAEIDPQAKMTTKMIGGEEFDFR